MLCDARRGALTDAVRAARGLAKQKTVEVDLLAATVLEAMWEAVSCLELAANVAAPWVDRHMQSPHGRWAEMTKYDPTRANRFYESSHKWTDERFAALSGHRFDNGESLVDVLGSVGFDDDRFTDAFEQAEKATTRFLRGRFEHLAAHWSGLRGYAAAYEHGLLLVPSAYGQAVDEQGAPLARPLIVWATRKDEVLWPDATSTSDLIDLSEAAGGLAIDLADYVCDARLRMVESLTFDDDGIFLGPLQNPIPYWVEKGTLSDETIGVLDGMRLNWISPEQNAE